MHAESATHTPRHGFLSRAGRGDRPCGDGYDFHPDVGSLYYHVYSLLQRYFWEGFFFS